MLLEQREQVGGLGGVRGYEVREAGDGPESHWDL